MVAKGRPPSCDSIERESDVDSGSDDLASLAVAAKDPRFRALFDAEFAFVWRTLRRMGVAHVSLDDASQRVFMVLGAKLDRVEVGRERSFLFGVARRIASLFRRGAREAPAIDDHLEALVDRSPLSDDLVDQKRARELLDLVLATIPPDLRDVLILHEGEGMTVTEIAAMLDLARGTAASRLRRAREAFDAALARTGRRHRLGEGT
jgi:RNA polymerase sigma-70 factor (ECF subfamily)